MFNLGQKVREARAVADLTSAQEREACENLHKALAENHTARTRLLERLASNENIVFKAE